MLTDAMINELYKLNRNEKMRIVQLLVNNLAEEFDTTMHYEVWSPFDSAGTAEALLKMLEEEKQQKND